MPLILYHGLNNPSLTHVVEKGALTPRVCAEGGPNAIYFSEVPLQYHNMIQITVPDEEVGYGKKFTPYANKQYICCEPISLLEYNLEITKFNGTNFKELAENIRNMSKKKGKENVEYQLKEMWENEENTLVRVDSLVFDFLLDPEINGWDWRENFQNRYNVNENKTMKQQKTTIRMNESEFMKLVTESVTKVLSEEKKDRREYFREYNKNRPKKDRRAYYREYNKKHPERLNRGFTKGYVNGNLSDGPKVKKNGEIYYDEFGRPRSRNPYNPTMTDMIDNKLRQWHDDDWEESPWGGE